MGENFLRPGKGVLGVDGGNFSEMLGDDADVFPDIPVRVGVGLDGAD